MNDDQTNGLDQSIIDSFWERKSQEESNRWTSSELFEFEYERLTAYAKSGGYLLDLGAGSGELSRALAGSLMTLTAVDYQGAYAKAFTARNHSFVCSRVQDYLSSNVYNLILLMGVVTHLEPAVERKVYLNSGLMLDTHGTFVVKNQCSRSAGFSVQGFSEALGSDYCGRYPSVEEQQSVLLEYFEKVEILKYPSKFNTWADSFHVMFLASRSKR